MKRTRDVDLIEERPRPLTLDVLVLGLVRVQGAALGLESLDVKDLLGSEAVLGDDGAFRIGEGQDGRAELHGFERGVLGDVAVDEV